MPGPGHSVINNRLVLLRFTLLTLLCLIFFPFLNIAAHQWHTAEAAIIISHGSFIYWSDICLFFLIYMFLYSLFSVSNHTLTLRSKAATLADACVPPLFTQTGYYDFPKSGSILTQAKLIILIVICLDLHHIPHKQYCMQMCDLFSYSCFLVGAMKHGCWSHSL